MTRRLHAWWGRWLQSLAHSHNGRPAVSVIVPVFGTEAYLGECLQSLIEQSFRSMEIIVVDDASPGQVDSAVESFLGQSVPVTLLRHPTNRGPLAARVTGAAAARGRYLAFVDSDDWVDGRFVETLYGAASAVGADLVQCAIQLSQDGEDDLIVNRGGSAHTSTGPAVLAEFLAGGMSNSLCNKMIRAKVWQSAVRQVDAPLRTIRFAEDLLCLFHVVLASRSYSHINEPLYHYVRRRGSVTLAVDPAAASRQEVDLRRVYNAIIDLVDPRNEHTALAQAFVAREFPIGGLGTMPL